LWTDALCIAQGDVEEWKTVSLKMAEAYSHAFVTIAADASLTSEESFLDFDTQRYRELSTDIEGPGLEISGANSRILALIREESLYDSWERSGFPPRASMMATRGWTFQEGLLSRRVLSFRHTHVHFRCMGEGIRGAYFHDSTFGNEFEWRKMLRSSGATHLSVAELMPIWSQVLVDYTPRDLTKAT
jgi:hypothetical protein